MDDMGFNPKSSVVDQMEIRDQVGSMVFDDANTEQVQPPVKGKKRQKKANSAVAGTFLRVRANSGHGA
jgi:hypothetical protein